MAPAKVCLSTANDLSARPVEWVDSLAACRDVCDVLTSTALVTGEPVAVDLEGSNFSRRDGEICIIQAAGRTGPVYLFDVLKLGNGAFEATLGGLKPLLEHRSVKKLFFDARADADVLLHRYGISLSNIRDMQVLHASAVGGGESLWGLGKVADSLQLPAKLRRRIAEVKSLGRAAFLPASGGSLDIWKTRPLPSILQEYAAVDVDILFLIYAEHLDAVSDSQLEFLSCRRVQLALAAAPGCAGWWRDFPVPMELRTLCCQTASGLPEATAAQLRSHFQEFGPITRIFVDFGTAWVVFAEEAGVSATLAAGNQHYLEWPGARFLVDRPSSMREFQAQYFGHLAGSDDCWDREFDSWGAGVSGSWVPLVSGRWGHASNAEVLVPVTISLLCSASATLASASTREPTESCCSNPDPEVETVADAPTRVFSASEESQWRHKASKEEKRKEQQKRKRAREQERRRLRRAEAKANNTVAADGGSGARWNRSVPQVASASWLVANRVGKVTSYGTF